MSPSTSGAAQTSRYGKWWDKYRETAAFHSATGRLPCGADGNSGASLGRWVETQRADYRAGKLDERQVEALQKIGGLTPPKNWHDEAWAANFAELRTWCDTSGRLPRRTADPGPERRLADFVGHQRRLAANGQLKEDRRQMLSAVPGVLKTSSYAEVRQAAWEAKVAEVRTWHSDHGRLPKFQNDFSGKENKLAGFVARQRKLKAEGRLSNERLRILSAVPGVFDTDANRQRPSQKLQAQWDSSFAALLAWYTEHGALPKGDRSELGSSLARFVARQRLAQANGRLSEQRRDLLESIPGVITAAQKNLPAGGTSWDLRLEAFTEWIRAGNVIAPSSSPAQEDPVAEWAARQIAVINSGLMPPERRARFLHAARPGNRRDGRTVKKPFTTNLTESLLEEAKAIVVANYGRPEGYRSLTDFVERAMLAEVIRAQAALNDGFPYSGGETAALPLRVGRPLGA